MKISTQALYIQATGLLVIMANDFPVFDGYSGAPGAINNGTFENKRNHGPIPVGKYMIGEAVTRKKFGPLVMSLTPVGHTAHGRSGFLIHGDNAKGDRSASTGCIIVDRDARELLAAEVASAYDKGELPVLIVR